MEEQRHKNKYSLFTQNTRNLFALYLERSNIHGFTYFAFQHLHLIEK